MRLFVLVMSVAALSLAPFGARNAAACSFSGPVPTPPEVGAQLGSDCTWHLLDGTVLPAFEGMEDLLSQYYSQTEDGHWVPSGLAQAEAADDEDLPVYIILSAAFIVPLAVLFVWTFVIRPKGGGH